MLCRGETGLYSSRAWLDTRSRDNKGAPGRQRSCRLCVQRLRRCRRPRPRRQRQRHRRLALPSLLQQEWPLRGGAHGHRIAHFGPDGRRRGDAHTPATDSRDRCSTCGLRLSRLGGVSTAIGRAVAQRPRTTAWSGQGVGILRQHVRREAGTGGTSTPRGVAVSSRGCRRRTGCPHDETRLLPPRHRIARSREPGTRRDTK